jgi:thiamine-phosphate pyrophosphorylase
MSQIYLISPPKFELKAFSKSLESALKTGLVPSFQLRLKDYEESEILKISKELQKICRDNNCLFLLNDFWKIALDVESDGVHLGEEDSLISEVRKGSPENFVIGASCYNSRHLAIEASEAGADYVAFGAFFPTTTKVTKSKAETEILTWGSEMLNLPIVAIGGINSRNSSSLVESGADFLAVISYVWNHPLGEAVAIEELQKSF